ncbi:hypothetical protein BDW22DRAFT_1432708 [Trametopsis cervina]|nr:hypothetical protein BDW22DRAFT_1432708 [Trametopsis cervina]
MAIYLRYSRPLIALAVILFTLLAVHVLYSPLDSLAPTKDSLFGGNYFGGGARYGASNSLGLVIEEEEEHYKEALVDRERLVKKWGPKNENIKPFPANGLYYTIWDYFIPAFQCPHRVQRVGTLADGGKWFCGVERYTRQRAPCVIYSFGINGESSFEAQLLKAAPQCELWGYDFSVSSFGPEIENDPDLKARSHFFPYALGGEDIERAEQPTYTLQTLMKQNGHSFIDILKIDIEGAEFQSLSAFVDHFVPPGTEGGKDGVILPVGQLQLEIHAWGHNVAFPFFRSWWENLERAGLRPFYTEPNLIYLQIIPGAKPDLAEYSFINAKVTSAMTDDRY